MTRTVLEDASATGIYSERHKARGHSGICASRACDLAALCSVCRELEIQINLQLGRARSTKDFFCFFFWGIMARL